MQKNEEIIGADVNFEDSFGICVYTNSIAMTHTY